MPAADTRMLARLTSGRSRIDGQGLARSVRVVLIGALALSLLAAPAAAQEGDSGASSDLCGTDGMADMTRIVEGAIQLMWALGMMGAVVMYKADTVVEIVARGPEQRKQVKKHKQQIIGSSVVLILLGPFVEVAGAVMNIPIASCVSVIPW